MSVFVPRKREGQAMLLTILALGGTMLGATTIAGLLMIYQIRQATDLANSGKALFAADSGLEIELYRFFQDPMYPDPPGLVNGSAFLTSCIDSTGVATPCDATSTVHAIKSIGISANSQRAFLMFMQNATTTY